MKKIDFTCKKVSLKDMIQCNYSLNDSEYAIFAELMKTKKGLSVKEIVERVGKDRTTVQKILSKLLKRGLSMKRQMNLDRGFMFVYFSKNKNEIVSEIETNVESYFLNLKDSLNKWKAKINI
jgi:predicted transcriptional regulator